MIPEPAKHPNTIQRSLIVLTALLTLSLLLIALDRLFPPPELDSSITDSNHFAQVVLARDGALLRAFPDKRHIWRYPVRLSEVSPLYLQALLAYEDRFFYQHPGVNPASLCRAAWQWLKQGRIVSGGSTLTMQTARLLEPHSRTIPGKLRQILRALQLEHRYSKEAILTYYLNHAPMGGVLEGVEAASRSYFGKPSHTLSHAEATLLAVLPQSPSRLRPDRYPKRAQVVRDKALARMAGLWDAESLREALSEPVYALQLESPQLAPLLAERLHQAYPREDRILTSLDTRIQELVSGLVLDRVRLLPPRVSIAALVMETGSGAVLAYVGSADFSDPRRFSHVDMVRARRSPGSTLKPFLYGMALDEGLIHSESLLADVPRSFGGYQPGNFQQSFHGPVSVAEALTRSLNVPAVEVLDQLGPARFVAGLRQGGLILHLPRDAEPNLSVILGGAATSLDQLVGAYSALARSGIAIQPRLLVGEAPKERRMLSPGAAFIVRDILESGGTLDQRLGTRVGARQGVAWKTGTSFGFRDAWSLGVSDRYCIGVWVGRPDGTPNPGFFGANVAAPLLLDLFHALDSRVPGPRIPPDTVSRAEICWPLGLAAEGADDPVCVDRKSAWLLHRTAPPTFPDPLYQGRLRFSYFVSADGRRRLGPDCREAGMRLVQAVRWPALLEPWLSPEQRRRATPPPWESRCKPPQEPGHQLVIAGLEDGVILRRTASGAAPLVELRARGAVGEVFWLVDGKLLARTEAGEPYRLAFTQAGVHALTAVDAQGAYQRVNVVVQ